VYIKYLCISIVLLFDYGRLVDMLVHLVLLAELLVLVASAWELSFVRT